MSVGFAQDAVDLAARVVDDVEDALLLLGARRVCGLRHRTEQLTQGSPQVDLRRIGVFGDLLPRWCGHLLCCGPSFLGQLEEPLAALGTGTDDQAFVYQQLQGRVHRAGARAPQVLAALSDFLDHLVAVHRPLGEQHQNCSTDVTATATLVAAAATRAGDETESARAEAPSEAGTEPRTEAGSERTPVTGIVAAQVVTEFA